MKLYLAIGALFLSAVQNVGFANNAESPIEQDLRPINSSTPISDTPIPGTLAVGISAQQTDFQGFSEETEGKIALDRLEIKVPFGKFDVGEGFFVPALAMDRVGFRFDGLNLDDNELYTLKAPMTYVKKLDQKWTRVIVATPSVHSDLEVYDDEAFSMMGLLMWNYSQNKQESWSMGIGANRLFGVYKPIPLLSYRYKKDDWKFDVGFPVTKAEWINQTGTWTAFSSIAPLGGNWRYSPSVDNDERINLSYTSWQAALGVRRNIAKKFWLTLKGGYNFERKIEFRTEQSIGEGFLEPGGFIGVSFGIHGG